MGRGRGHPRDFSYRRSRASRHRSTDEFALDGTSGDACQLTVWSDPEAWSGMTQAGPVEIPGDVAGLVAAMELVVHGWDVGRASGQAFEVDDVTLHAVRDFVSQVSGPDDAESRGDAFGRTIEPPPGAALLDQVVALSGRRPDWTADGQ